MVNKNYKINHASASNINSNGNLTDNINCNANDGGKQKQTQKMNIKKHYSPPVIRNSSRILNSPNPYDSPETYPKTFSTFKNHQRTSSLGNKSITDTIHMNNNGNGNICNIENTYEQLIIDDKLNNGNCNFGRNIALSYDTVSLASETYQKIGGQRQFDIKDVVVSDMGRFQYIVQMDKDVDPSFYNQPVTSSSASSSSTLEDQNSVSNRSLSFKSFQNNKINRFWKTDKTKYHLTTLTTTTSSLSSSFRDRTDRLLNIKRSEIKEHIKTCWSYTKWPIFLLLSCLMLSLFIYIIYLGLYRPLNENDKYIISSTSKFVDTNHLDYTDESAELDSENDEHLKHFIIPPQTIPIILTEKNPNNNRTEVTTVDDSLESNESKTDKTEMIISTTKTPIRNTKIIKFTTKQGFNLKDDDDEIESERMNDKNVKKTILIPVQYTNNGHSAGHQPNFNVPIEEDERTLRLFNEQLIKLSNHESSTTEKAPSTSTLKVSPTLPSIIHHKDTSPGIKPTTETVFNSENNSADIDICQSTSLEMCQGVLQYDLTTTKSKQTVATIDMADFKYLIASNCSNRAAEFICSYLEPECRPLRPLEPCKRICKSILEPCSSVIASSEILTITFDCDRYPDSSDRNVCEDPTRRSVGGKCHDNEFQCLDSTCIPKQWKCDNIKDCPLGEDEENCKFCHHEEFRCQSDSSCIDGNLQCNGFDDCSDGSDENDCFDYDPSNNDDDDEGDDNDGNYNDENYGDDNNAHNNEDYPMPRIYSFASIQSPDNPDSLPFFAIPIDEDGKGSKMIEENSNRGGGLFDEDNISFDINLNDDKNQTKQNETVKEGGISKSLANFQDSTEIMMTSDSEHDFKYSKYRTNRTRNTVAMAKNAIGAVTLNDLKRSAVTTTKNPSTTSQTTQKNLELKTTTTKENLIIMPAVLADSIQYCPEGELRCVSGECITVDQLCDKKIDCPDGADEARCYYNDDSN